MKQAWAGVSPEIIRKSFRKTGISLALDGTEDDELFASSGDEDPFEGFAAQDITGAQSFVDNKMGIAKDTNKAVVDGDEYSEGEDIEDEVRHMRRRVTIYVPCHQDSRTFVICDCDCILWLCYNCDPKLINKLNKYGVCGKTNKWISSFLNSRTQKVLVEGESSALAQVVSGVPQGSVLGPSLFLFYINDMPENISSTVRLFADDTIVYLTLNPPTNSSILQEDLNKLSSIQINVKYYQ